MFIAKKKKEAEVGVMLFEVGGRSHGSRNVLDAKQDKETFSPRAS